MRSFLFPFHLLLLLLITATSTSFPRTTTAFAPSYSCGPSSSFSSSSPRQQRRGRRQRVSLAAASSSDAVSLDKWVKTWKKSVQEDGGPTPKTSMFSHASLAEVLAEIFDQVLKADKAEKGAPPPQHLLLFPEAQALYQGPLMRQFGDHLDLCKECCEVLGVSQNTIVMHPTTTSEQLQCPVPGVLIKGIPQGASEFSDDDPYWNDDDEGFNFNALYQDEDDAEAQEHERLYVVPEEDGPIMQGMRQWVDAIIADLGVCPFTVNAEKAGLPQGAIRYDIDRSVSPEEIYRKYWQEVALISKESATAQDERALSTTLLITPNFGLRNREYFESFSNTLTQPLEALGLEEEIQLVFFHPEWVFRDGADRMGNEDAANYARRSPWPMINILRTPQVRKAQKAIPTGLVYRQNEVTLDKIGSRRLRKWLTDRDWSDVKDNFRVDRKTVPILSTAQDLLQGLTPQALSEDTAVVAPAGLEAAVQAATTKEEEEEEEDVESENDGGMVDEEQKGAASASAVAYAAEAAAKAAKANKGFFGGGFENEFADMDLGGADDDDDDDWDTPLPKSQSLLDIENDPNRVKRPMSEIVSDSKAVIALLRKRLSQNLPLSPAEIQDFESRAKRMQTD